MLYNPAPFPINEPVNTEEDQEEPHKYWYTDIIKPKRPKVTLAPLLNYKQ